MDQDQQRDGRDPSRSQERTLAGNSSDLSSSGAVQPSEGPPQRGGGPPIRGRRSNLSGRFGGRDLVTRDGGMGLLGSGDPSLQRLNTPFVPPKKRTFMNPPPPLFHSQHRSGSEGNSSSQQPAKMRVDPPRSSLAPPPIPSAKAELSSSRVNTSSAIAAPPTLLRGGSTKTESSSRVTTTGIPAPPPLKGGADVVAEARKYERSGDPNDVLGLSSWIAKKRSLSRMSSASANVEEAAGNKVVRKKTRLGWGQGLAKYERELREQNAQKPAADGTAPSSSSAGGNDDLGKNKTSTTANDPASTVLAAAVQDKGDHGNSSRISSEMAISSAEVPAVSGGHISPPAVGGNTDPGNISTRMREMLICPPGSNNDTCDSRRSMDEIVVSPTTMLSSSQGRSLPAVVGENNAFGSSSSSFTETGVCPIASSQGCLPQDGRNIISTNDQGVPHKLMAQSRLPATILEKLQEPRKSVKKNLLSEQRQSDKLQGSRSSTWSQEEKDVFSEKIITFGMDFTKISSFLRHKTTMDCIEYYSNVYKSEYSKQQAEKCHPTMKQSQDKCKNENNAAPFMSGIATVTAAKNYGSTKTLAEDIKQPVHLSFHESVLDFQSHSSSDKGHRIEPSMEGDQCVTRNATVAQMDAPSSPGTISPVTSSSQAVDLTLPKIEEPVLKNLNTKSCPSEEIRTEEQELWTDDERCRLIQATEKHGKDFASISVYVKTKSIEQCKSFLSKYQNDLDLGKTHVSSINPCIATNVAELSGNEFVQALKDSETVEVIDLTGSDVVKGNEENPQQRVSSKESGGTQLICNVNSNQEKEKVVAIISSAENNDTKAPEVQTLDGEPKFPHTPPTNSGAAAALNTVHAISSPVERDIDLNIPLDVDRLVTPAEHVTAHGEASTGLKAPSQTSDAAAMKGEPKNEGKAAMDSGAESENSNDWTPVQIIRRSRTATRGTSTQQTANQPRCIRLFGQVIHEAPSLETNITSNQGNQIIFHDLAPNNTVVPSMPRSDSRACPPGPSTGNVSANTGQQQQPVLSSMMPYGPLNSSAWAFGPGSSGLFSMSQQRPPVNMAAYGMMRGGVPYPYHLMRPGSSSLIDFNHFNPGQQLWQGPSGVLDTSGMVIGYPFLPGGTQHQQHAPTDFVPPRIHGDGPSTSNIRFPAPGRGGRGRGRGRGRGNSPW